MSRRPPKGQERPAPRPRPASRPAAPGEWLMTTRAGAEEDLVEELALLGYRDARVFAAALVVSPKVPRRDGRVELTFARQGFRIDSVRVASSIDALGSEIAEDLGRLLSTDTTYTMHVWVPDTDAGNLLSEAARELRVAIESRLSASFPNLQHRPSRELLPDATPLVQVCLHADRQALSGVGPAARALSLAPGGRLRAKVPGDRPSRAARKLAEAFAWFGVTPEPGETCVDLGAAPGGWAWLLLQYRARVIAVDPAKLRPDLLTRRGLVHVQRSAFDFVPDEPVDWLFCDMAWRPLEVAQMLARWARRKWASLLVANFKLPMKRKAEMVRDVRATLEAGGWRGVRTRQLYHDRDEITLTARVS